MGEQQRSWEHSFACAWHDGEPCTCKDADTDSGLPLTTGEGNTARKALIAACPTPTYHKTHRYCPSCPWTEKDDDPDYSPAYQDEYQRLWHEARAECSRLREQLDAARQALAEIADTPVLRRAKYSPNGYADNATEMRDRARAALGVEGPA